MNYLDSDWFNKVIEAHRAGIDHIYDFGIQAIRDHNEWFYKQEKDKDEPYCSNYSPNPFRYQYDLCVFCWINYYRLLEIEIQILKKKDEENPFDGHGDDAIKMGISNTLYGISRSDFFFAASELRWPTSIKDNGQYKGLLIRDPWAEKRIDAYSSRDYQNVISFGGGGQGKTTVPLAFALIVFDYFIFTQKGARCMISTVNKGKLDSASWAYLCNLNSSTAKNISLYAGRAKISGDHTLTRPGNKDKGGVFKGILIGNKMNNQNIVDKLTGSHGHPFIVYIIDEMQSTPDPPIMAAPNYTMHAGDYRIIGAGNYGDNNDTLAENIIPDDGWDSVTEDTGQWISTMKNSFKAIVLHFNNNNSPAMDPVIANRFPHLPNKENLNKSYPDKSKRNLSNESYRRFWVGYRVEGDTESVVLTDSLLKENLADGPLDLSRILHSFFAFDSAQAEVDRNMFIPLQEGICNVTGQRVFGPIKAIGLEKSTESIKYYQESTAQILKLTRKYGITSGAGIVDWTGRPAHAGMLMQNGFMVHKLIYNMSLPDGVRRDKITGRIEKKIRIETTLDFKDIGPDILYAHQICENRISLGAWALREYVKAGRVRNIGKSLLDTIDGCHHITEELFSRKFKYKISGAYGKRFNLESKDDFKKEYGFSPDILDCLFQAAYYMLIVRRLPLTPVGIDSKVDEEIGRRQVNDDHLDLWKGDELALLE